MGAVPATLFLLSVWHFRWTTSWFYFCSSYLITMYKILLFVPAPQMHTYTFTVCSAFSLLSHPFCLKHVLASLSFVYVILPSIVVIVFFKGENQYLFSQGNDSFFLALSFCLFVLAEWLQLPSLSFPLSLCSLLSSPVSPDFSSSTIFFHLLSLFQLSSLLVCEYVWQKSSLGATLPLSCEDQWWH